MRNKLSETKVRALRAPGIYSDGDGLYLRVARGGSKSWTFIWRRGDERREIGLGGYGRGTAPVSLALARERAEVVRGRLAAGQPVRNEPAAPPEPGPVNTFAMAMTKVIELRAPTWKNAKHADQWRMTLGKYAEPLHAMAVDKIGRADVLAVLEPHWNVRPETAERLRLRIEAVLDYAAAQEWRGGANPAAREGLKDVLPPRKKLGRGHHAAADYGDIPIIVAGLRSATGTAAPAAEFLCLTATRSGEVRGAVWSEIDLGAKLWTIPGVRMKAGVEHRVPLSDRCIEILERQVEFRRSDIVFEGYADGRPVSDTAMTKAVRRAARSQLPTLHGFRSSFRDWAGDQTNHPREVCEAALAHSLPSVEAAYRRRDALEKRRTLMSDWAMYYASKLTVETEQKERIHG